ncbi:polyphosphate kinase 2 family protein [Dyella solisilvae]|nr:polyphosphate kinase 2 family protein [Dyella solisilvae]
MDARRHRIFACAKDRAGRPASLETASHEVHAGEASFVGRVDAAVLTHACRRRRQREPGDRPSPHDVPWPVSMRTLSVAAHGRQSSMSLTADNGEEASMPRKEILDALSRYTDPFRVTDGKGFRLKDFDPGDTLGLKMDKEEAVELLQRGSEWLAMEQDILYAQDSWSLLLVFQAMDAAGKDGTIKHVMSRVNPQGCDVFSFKQPSSEELAHDFLWRYSRKVPRRGHIGIFNRSYYEEVLVVRVHQALLSAQKIPPTLIGKKVWDERLDDIDRFEEYLSRQGVIILKFYLNLSYKEQKKRFMDRLDKPNKNWKFSASDVRERRYWNDYMQAYEAAIRGTATPAAPWFVVPADNKWFTRLVVAAAIVETLEKLDLAYPKVTSEQKKDLAAAREELKAES